MQAARCAWSLEGRKMSRFSPVYPAVVVLVLTSGPALAAPVAVAQDPENAREALRLDLSFVKKSGAAYERFKSYVDQALGGDPGYGFSGTDAAIMYRLDGAGKYARLAIKLAEAQVSSAEEKVAHSDTPEIAGDSYLNVGPMLSDLALVYAWMPGLLTDTQKNRYKAYADQAIYNVWHHTLANWYSTAVPWSGWCADPMDPGDNYFYSFITASALWALASNNPEQMAFVKGTLLPALERYFSVLPDGGSIEGTGYGASHKNLFALYQILRDSGIALGTNMQKHVTGSIYYWVNATVPTLDYYAPFGDLSRDSIPSLFDYHRQIVLEARNLTDDSAARAVADWWLGNISVRQMSHGFESRFDLLPQGMQAQPPEKLTYVARGVGQVFSRTSWKKDAVWFSFVAGILNQSHEGHQQGAFALYKKGWLTVTGNIYSHSGIQQSVKLNNVLRFERGSEVLEQREGTARSEVSAGENGDVKIVANLTPIAPAKTTWERTAEFVGGKLTINDNYSAAEGIAATFQFVTPTRPTIQDQTITAGGLKATVLTPNAVIKVTPLNSIDADFNSGYRVDIGGGAGSYAVVFESR